MMNSRIPVGWRVQRSRMDIQEPDCQSVQVLITGDDGSPDELIGVLTL